ncbi:DUF983 domain-containing protein [Altererythrobacter sp. ZODW24]|uniref:DUF983 domain-containing protein n=1 Tax=Altererythrobacter sp. ZODW24 TaxID=2185142 RepID=UPI000DF7C175|nr:DUF983 domain-containing protein [Altererythrobacter sp. ZODW24]
MPSDSPNTKGQPGSAAAALFGCCPRCNERTLFEGPVKFAPRCTECQLEFSNFNVGDGPAGFLTLIIGALITGLAIWLEVSVTPPFWVHVTLWVPLTAAAVVLGLRMAKAALLQAEYHQRAGEAQNPSESEDA